MMKFWLVDGMKQGLLRRNFLRNSLLASAGMLASGAVKPMAWGAGKEGNFDGKVSLFTKHFVGLKYEALAEAVVKTGVDGVDAPVRKNGHVEPERVEEDLPKLAEALTKHGVPMNLITSGINEVSAEQNTEKVLRTAKALGVTHYRMNYFRYDLKKPILPQVEEWKPKIKDLVALSKEIGITPIYQNHSGTNYFGAPIWDAYAVMKEYDPREFAFAFDILHAMIEGGKSWPLELALVKEHIGVAYFKNFTFKDDKFANCPLGEGLVKADYVKQLKATGWSGPISLHVEYLEGSVKDEGYLDKAIAMTKADAVTLRDWLAKA